MLPRLQAEEMLDGATVAALGAGTMTRGDAQSVMRDLRRRMNKGRRSRRAGPGELAHIGIEAADG